MNAKDARKTVEKYIKNEPKRLLNDILARIKEIAHMGRSKFCTIEYSDQVIKELNNLGYNTYIKTEYIDGRSYVILVVEW